MPDIGCIMFTYKTLLLHAVLLLVVPSVLLGQLMRESNSSIDLTGPPVSDSVYSFQPVYTGFSQPVALVQAPSDVNRLFVLEKTGQIKVITNLEVNAHSTFLRLTNRTLQTSSEQGLLGMAFHPGYPTNGFFYVYYTPRVNGTNVIRVSRFSVSDDPNVADEGSEVELIRQRNQAGNHNGGDLHFGPDGYLYVSVGDEGGSNDSWNNSQRIDKDLFSGILRIDVDQRAGSLAPHAMRPGEGTLANFTIPPDNPFIGATQFNGSAVTPSEVRTEFYAVGLRNPWRMSFDEVTGILYCGDVGQGRYEEIDLITSGGNYGWAVLEGFHNGPDYTAASTNWGLADPVYEYAHGNATNQGNSVTGGRVYRGSNLPELVGKYVFGDYSSGHIWAMEHDGTQAVNVTWLTREGGVVGFGADPRDGELLVADINNANVRKLVKTSGGDGVPPSLDDTGIFRDMSRLTPENGVVPYTVNLPFWSDNALKRGWFSIPNTNDMISFRSEDPWLFPTGTVWVEHFELAMTNGVAASRRRIETRILAKESDGVAGWTYRWGVSATNAYLVPEQGLDETFVIHEPGGGVLYTQVWHYPSRSECLVCHNETTGGPLGFNTGQMNRNRVDGSLTNNQLTAFSEAGYFDAPLPDLSQLRTLVGPSNTAWNLEYRVRSYLDVNCSYCHTPGYLNNDIDLRLKTPLSQAGLIDAVLNNDLGDTANRVVLPGDVVHSALHSRINTLGTLRMPPLGANLIDSNNVALVANWIAGLSGYESFSSWQLRFFGVTNGVADATFDFDDDGAVNRLEWLTGTDPTHAVPDAWSIDSLTNAGSQGRQVGFRSLANRGFDLQYCTNLMEAIWHHLGVPENQPFSAAVDFNQIITDPATNSRIRAYRVEVYEF